MYCALSYLTTPPYNRHNEAVGGCTDADPGLSEFGRSGIREMESVGTALCCSHTGERTCMEAFEWSRNPVMLTHSNPLCGTSRPGACRTGFGLRVRP